VGRDSPQGFGGAQQCELELRVAAMLPRPQWRVKAQHTANGLIYRHQLHEI
jgi:hypothetical protein